MKRTQHIAYFKVPYKQKDNDNYQNNDNFCCGDKKSSKGDGITDNEDPELNQFYYHSDHLGSSSYITNLSGNIVQHIEYVPFGEVFLEERNNKWNTPYLFNGKELDEETGFYYYGARYYSGKTSLWLSVDPLAEKYPGISPYCYTLNNPINLVDPDGREVDGYTIDKEGYINRVDKTGGENFDVLYRKDEYDKGNREYSNSTQKDREGIRVDNKKILKSLKEVDSNNNSTIELNEKNKYDAYNVFKYGADNSEVEYSLFLYKRKNNNKYRIGTSHLEGSTVSHEYYGIETNSMILKWHSHPNIEPSQELSSMGKSTTGFGGFVNKNDWTRMIEYRGKSSKDPFLSKVYFPKTGNIYKVASWDVFKVGKAKKH